MATSEKYLDAKVESVSEAIKFIEENLKKYHVKKKDSIKAQLLAEEFFVQIVKSKQEGDSEDIRVAVTKKHTKLSVIVSYKGKQIEEIKNVGLEVNPAVAEMPVDAEERIRKIMIFANHDNYTAGYKNGINKISINVGESGLGDVKRILFALVLAIVVGVALRLFVSPEVNTFLNDKIFDTITTLFLNAFKLITGPVIFFSIASCISMFSDMKEMGKTAGKIMAFYFTTTFAAVAIAMLFFAIFSPGEFGGLEGLATGEVVEAGSISIKQTIIDIVPDNFIKAFLELNTLQIMVIAILVGLGAAKLGEKSEKVSEFISNANELFLKVTSFVTKFIPIMLFVSIASMIVSMDMENLKSMFGVVGLILLAYAAMFAFYNIVVMISTKTSPIYFIKNTFGAYINALALQSSNAAMPYSMNVCDKGLKISPKIYSFSIPLGATINMDGAALLQTISLLFFAKMFGVSLSGGDIVVLIALVFILSIAAPGIPGTSTVCMSVLFAQFGVPMAALALFVSYYSFMACFSAANNVYGDITGSYVIAKRSGMVHK